MSANRLYSLFHSFTRHTTYYRNKRNCVYSHVMLHSPHQKNRLISDANDNVGLEKKQRKMVILRKVKLLNINKKITFVAIEP